MTHYCIFVLQASTDQSAVDLNIPYQISAFAFSFIQLLGIIAVMSQVAWQVFIVFIPVIATCVWYQVLFINKTYLVYNANEEADKVRLPHDI